MKKHSKSIGFVLIILSLILAMAVGLSGCVTVNPPASTSPPSPSEPTTTTLPTPTSIPASVPQPPDIPQEVLTIWKAEPVSGAYPSDISEQITLLPNLASDGGADYGDISLQVVATKGSWQNSMNFYLQEGQWVDVIASSIDTPIYFLTEEPGAVSFHSLYLPKEGGTATYSQDMGIFAPFYSKLLYENVITSTDKGTLLTTAARLFAWHDAGDYCFNFTNYSSQKGCEITYRIYKHDTTPGWGKPYMETKLQPWLNHLYNLLVSGEITEEEYDKAESQWLEQLD